MTKVSAATHPSHELPFKNYFVLGDKQKKGKIQIRNLKYSSVFQETVKAVEEKQKKEQARKEEIEEGELSDSSESERQMDCDGKADFLTCWQSIIGLLLFISSRWAQCQFNRFVLSFNYV